LKHLGISKADFFGDSYGANTVAMIAIRHPDLARRVVACAGTFGPPDVALNPKMTRFEHAPFLEKPARTIPVATANSGYQPGVTR